MVNGYLVLNKADRISNIQSVKTVLERCVETMISPKMMHFIVEVKFDVLPSKIIQTLKEAYNSEFKKYEKDTRHGEYNKLRKRKCPNIEIIYSIESKMLDRQYDHIHFMFIVDFEHNRFNYREVISIINRTLGKLKFVVPIKRIDDFTFNGFKGVNSCGYCRYRDKKSTIVSKDACTNDDGSFKEIRGHDLKSEFDDAMIRASYLCKSEQKELLPPSIKNYSFGHTRAARSSKDIVLDMVA